MNRNTIRPTATALATVSNDGLLAGRASAELLATWGDGLSRRIGPSLAAPRIYGVGAGRPHGRYRRQASYPIAEIRCVGTGSTGKTRICPDGGLTPAWLPKLKPRGGSGATTSHQTYPPTACCRQRNTTPCRNASRWGWTIRDSPRKWGGWA